MIALLPVLGLPEVRPGDDLATLIAAHAGDGGLADGDVVVVAQKIVSKAEGALVAVPPGVDRAAFRASLVRREAVRVVAEAPWTVIVETRHGFVCANAGIDASNVEGDVLALLPEDPDESARRLRSALSALLDVRVGVVVTDTFGRPWRVGQTEVAIGLAGVPALRDERGRLDRDGAPLAVTVVALADELAAAADLVRRKASGIPVVVVRGLADEVEDDASSARDLLRSAASDLFPRGRGMVAAALATAPAPDSSAGRPVDEVPAVALAAARPGGGGGGVVSVDAARVRLTCGSAYRLGRAVGALLAALADLGLECAVGEPAGGAVHVVVTDPLPGGAR